MALYEVVTDDGSKYRVEAADNIRQEDLYAAVQQQMQRDRRAKLQAEIDELRKPLPEPPPKTTIGGEVKEAFKGIVPGAVGLAETAGAGIAALFPEDTEKAARAKLREIATSISEPFAAAPGYEDTIGRNIGQGLGSTLPFVLTGPFGMAGRAAAVGLGAAAGAGEARQAAEAKGVTGEDRALATALGTPVGLLDIFIREVPFAKNIIYTALKRGGVEGATEAAQKVAQNLIAKGVYDPSQPIFAGSGEEGAYGAGVGALASLLVDMTIGRRARGGQGGAGTTGGQEAPMQAGLPPTATQGDLFPSELRTAETAVMPPAPPPSGTQGELFTPEEAPTSEQQAEEKRREAEYRQQAGMEPLEAAPVAQVPQAGQMDLFAQPAAEPVAPVQRDMIAESETAQTEDMLRAEAIAPEVAARNEAEIARLRTRGAEQQAASELRGESELESTDARVADVQRKKTEADRLALLQPIIEDISVKNIPKAFGKTLADAGYTDLTFTPRELSLINRAYDVRLAEPAVTEVEPDVTAKETQAGLEGQIPERQPKVRQMQQMQLPGVPTPKLPKTAEDVEAAESTVITPQTLDGLGILKAAPLRQRIIGADVATPEGRVKVLNELAEYVSNPNTKDAPRKKITDFMGSPIFRRQTEMFGPKGGVLKPAVAKETKNVPTAKLEPTPTRVSPPSAGPRVGDSTGRVTTPTSTGVGGPSELAGKPKAGEKVQPPALKEEKPSKLKEAKPSKPKEAKPTEKKEEKPKAAKSKVETDIEKEKTEFAKRNFGAPITFAFENRFIVGDNASDIKKLESSISELFGTVLPDEATTALSNNDLVGALNAIADKTTGTNARVAKALAGVIGKTKVEFVKDLKDESGKSVAGTYNPKTDTISLNEGTGLNVHTFLHETVHAATSHVLANKSHPVTKQLTQLYNGVKGWLDTAYGATSLDEFVSEAMSNPEFQAKLQAINPKGDKITAWQRFVNTVGNFMRSMIGMSTKPLGSALDVTDGLVMSILAPAPDTRNAGMLYAASAMGNSSQVFKNLDASYLSAPSFQEGMDNVHEFLTGKVSNKIKDIARSALPLHALVEEAKRYVPKAPMVDRLINERAGSEGLRNQSIEPILAKVETWASSNPGKLDAFNATVYDSTLAQVDPTKSRNEYKEADDLKAWDAMQPNLKAIGPEGAALYKTMRDTYKKLYDEIIRIVNARIDATSEDKDRAKAIKTEIYSRLVARGGLDPYFPLTREGQYWMSYHAKNPRTNTTELYVEAFDTKRGRARAMEEYKAAGATDLQTFANLSSVNYRNAPPTSFINGVLKTLEANKVKPEVTEEVMRFFLSTLPETSFAKAFQARKGTLGFKQDAVRALRQKTISISRQLANMEYGAKLSQLRSDIEEEFKGAGQPEDAKPYIDAINEHIQFAISPQVPRWSKIARSFGFNMTLGFNVSSAVVNVAQVPLIVAPYLGGKYGTVATTKALAHATRMYMQSGFQRDVKTFVPVAGAEKTTVNAAPSLDNYDFDNKNAPEDVKRLKVLADVAGKLGQLNRSQLYDTLEVTDPKGSMLDRINAASGFVFHHGERMNRQVTMIAAYNLELDKMKAAGRSIDEAAMTEAAETAVYMTEMTNGGTSAASAPRIAQSGLGSVMFMFKRYGVSMYYLLFKTARDALRGADGQTRAAAMRQIAGIYGSAALFAGARGLPMFGMVAMLYNMFRDDDEDTFENATRKFLGEGLYSGAINATTGVDVASRIGLSDLIFRDQKYSESTSVIASLAETMGGPVFGVASRVERGLKLIGEGHTERGIEAILPSAMANLLRARRYAVEGATTLRGDPITGDISTWNVFAQTFGFAPAEYTRQLEINAVVKGIDKATNEKKTKLLRQFYIATRFGDTPTAQEALQELIKLQQKHPGLGIDADTIVTSMKQHAKTSATMYHGITLSKGMRGELLENAREFDEGYGDIENPFDED